MSQTRNLLVRNQTFYPNVTFDFKQAAGREHISWNAYFNKIKQNIKDQSTSLGWLVSLVQSDSKGICVDSAGAGGNILDFNLFNLN